MELKKLNGIKYFIEAIMEIRSRGFSEEEVSSCANIAATVEKLIVWHKSLPTYKEGNVVYI